MQKTKKIIAILFAVALMCTTLAACGSSTSSDPVVGTWQMTGVKAAGQTITVDQYLKEANIKTVPTMTFSADKKVSADMAGVKGSGTWDVKDGVYTIKDGSGTDLTLKLANNQLTLDYSGVSLVFEKKQ